ncbi:hypothetical protein [Methylobacterium oryzihabitans]|uniref:Uncharacterized protein n=1 Tax=Methylobacterium oryzihabitans TaxID=2499852 RepID=A0A437P7P8_9HYPH|nr:hypothetical protein [Methylobacterium oryzihabitans]RVU18118.1 hypothetical protein EOE48_12050 [Methylobacterium oryzihabitans]
MLASHLRLDERHVVRTSDGKHNILIDKDLLVSILKKALTAVNVDDEWYLDRYQDVRTAIARGEFKSARDHFVRFGYLEGRLPYAIPVDEAYYLDHNPDVRAGIEAGALPDAATHFYMSGASEGRLPSEGFTLFILG